MKKKNNLLKLLMALLILIIAIFFLTKVLSKKKPLKYQPSAENSSNINFNNFNDNISTDTRVYKSKKLKFKITVPAGYQLEERFTTVTLKNKDGEIVIDRLNSNYEDIQGYIKELEMRNKVIISYIKNLKINQKNSIVGLIKHPASNAPTEKIYFIYVEEWKMFSFSTSSPALFTDLDQIALSFEYVP